MDSTLTYKCPNCSAGLLFDADSQRFSCEFCLSEFTEAELMETGAAEREERDRREDADFEESVLSYHCDNCGAEVIADKNTVADFCYYCHNPIVMTGKVAGAMRPSRLIPFRFSKKEAEEHFIRYAKSKWFVPNDYFSEDTAKTISGVYYPFWVTDADTDSCMYGIGRTVRSWRSGDYRYTETKSYSVYRRGRIHFEDITTSALSTEDKAMLEGILPYPTDEYIDFSTPYLQGFVAKKRDIERESIGNEVKGRMNSYAESLLTSTVSGYSSYSTRSTDVAILHAEWQYSLLPVWVLTYKKKDKTYVYAMNGSTGKIYGELPISIPKILSLFGGIFLGAAALVLGIGFLFMI